MAVAAVVALWINPAWAQSPPTLEGRWAAGPLTTKWVVGDWGNACGPRPAGGGEPATSVIVKQTGGELVITGGGRTFSTAQCWEQYPGIQRLSHTGSSRGWRTTCRTPPGDPRQASLSTSLTATDDKLSFYEAGQYQFVIQGQNCTASVGRYRTYTLVQRAGTAEHPPPLEPSAVAPAPPPPKRVEPAPVNDRCRSPGPPARLEVRPARKLIRSGEGFSFRAVVADSAGCPVFAKPTWEVESGGDLLTVDSSGTVQVKPSAPEGEARLTASVGGRSALVTVEIASSERYDALLRSGAFNANGEVDEAASVAIASQSIGAGAAVAEDRASGRKSLFVGVVAFLALILGVVAALLLRRSKAAAKAQAAKDEAQRERRARALAEEAARRAEPAPPPPDTHARAHQEPAKPRKTICPVCGTQYGPDSSFCGKDGATLMPLN